MTKTEIANLAAQRMGVDQFISNVDTEQSQIALSLKACFDQERDTVLRVFPWPWATAYAALGRVAGTSSVPVNHDWQYSYRYPPDCLFARRLTAAGQRTSDVRYPFALGRDGSGRLIFADLGDAGLEYTVAVTAATEFDPAFASALAWRLVATVAPAQSRLPRLSERAVQMFLAELQIAQGVAANEGRHDPALEAESVRARV